MTYLEDFQYAMSVADSLQHDCHIPEMYHEFRNFCQSDYGNCTIAGLQSNLAIGSISLMALAPEIQQILVEWPDHDNLNSRALGTDAAKAFKVLTGFKTEEQLKHHPGTPGKNAQVVDEMVDLF